MCSVTGYQADYHTAPQRRRAEPGSRAREQEGCAATWGLAPCPPARGRTESRGRTETRKGRRAEPETQRESAGKEREGRGQKGQLSQGGKNLLWPGREGDKNWREPPVSVAHAPLPWSGSKCLFHLLSNPPPCPVSQQAQRACLAIPDKRVPEGLSALICFVYLSLFHTWGEDGFCRRYLICNGGPREEDILPPPFPGWPLPKAEGLFCSCCCQHRASLEGPLLSGFLMCPPRAIVGDAVCFRRCIKGLSTGLQGLAPSSSSSSPISQKGQFRPRSSTSLTQGPPATEAQGLDCGLSHSPWPRGLPSRAPKAHPGCSPVGFKLQVAGGQAPRVGHQGSWGPGTVENRGPRGAPPCSSLHTSKPVAGLCKVLTEEFCKISSFEMSVKLDAPSRSKSKNK